MENEKIKKMENEKNKKHFCKKINFIERSQKSKNPN